ncbi:glycosyltransferase [Chitinophaga sancti]|uniref:glycosyltransferase n=1 Tax=Chitinophaga sancti TaxID=1004 RepID=UPI002A74BB3C|nr:glycosyltransferase [Chitinophaga sancti]WPQ65870.1 glycosyltransferase [Chitinophaga sancti]
MDNLPNRQPKADLICFSHLRWNFVFQRPQHLMTRFTGYMRVFYVEEYVIDTVEIPFLQVNNIDENLWIVTPHLSEDLIKEEKNIITGLIEQLMETYQITRFISWYYTPMAMNYSRNLQPEKMIFDCMDELSAFKFSPPELKQREHELLNRCDMVFTGGDSLFQIKRNQHDSVFLFPSSIDFQHFSSARASLPDPEDQRDIPFPRMGFFGVIDERFDIALLKKMANKRPNWHFIMLGPIVKIDPASLPNNANIHYLGLKTYDQLPTYISNWEVALILFALNESTRFISPTKTPEYLAAGKPVVSTPIADVVKAYGVKDLVQIATSAETFIVAIQKAMDNQNNHKWKKAVDANLAANSWDLTWQKMATLIGIDLVKGNQEAHSKNTKIYV